MKSILIVSLSLSVFFFPPTYTLSFVIGEEERKRNVGEKNEEDKFFFLLFSVATYDKEVIVKVRYQQMALV